MNQQQINKTAELTHKALRKWGQALQLTVAIEELSELQKEICKNIRGFNNQFNIAEEIADCEIMLDQLKTIFDCHGETGRHVSEKLERLELRLKD